MKFSNKKGKPRLLQNTTIHKLVSHFSGRLSSAQRTVANWLTGQFEQLSTRKKKIALFAYFISFGGLSVLIAIQTLFFHAPVQISVSKALLPTNIGRASKDLMRPNQSTNPHSYLELKNVLGLLDSLSLVKDGRKHLDSILRANPGITDTIAFLEKSIPKLINK